MSRIGIYTDINGRGFRALVPNSQLPEEFGWTREEAVRRLMPLLRDEVYRLREIGGAIPRGLESLPPNTRGELHFVSV